MATEEKAQEGLLEEEELMCPLCYEKMDDTDLTLFPCPCNYQICVWCLNKLVDTKKPCPNCRREYKKENYRTISKSKLNQKVVVSENPANESMKEEEHRSFTESDSKDLQNIRVIQKNLVYVIGVANEVAKEDTLKRNDLFGQYGTLSKIVINMRSPIGEKVNSCGVYLTYETNEQALSCILAIDGYTFHHRMLKASYGTTKYCFAFTRGQKCTNPECMYLHKMADKEDCFTKEEMTTKQREFYEITHPGDGSAWNETLQRHVYRKLAEEDNTVLPPPKPIKVNTPEDIDADTPQNATRPVPRSASSILASAKLSNSTIDMREIKKAQVEKMVVSGLLSPRQEESPELLPTIPSEPSFLSFFSAPSIICFGSTSSGASVSLQKKSSIQYIQDRMKKTVSFNFNGLESDYILRGTSKPEVDEDVDMDALLHNSRLIQSTSLFEKKASPVMYTSLWERVYSGCDG